MIPLEIDESDLAWLEKYRPDAGSPVVPHSGLRCGNCSAPLRADMRACPECGYASIRSLTR